MTPSITENLVNLAITLAVPLFTALAYMLIDELKQRGYRTKYTEALVRAVGAGADAANQHGTTLFTPQGRSIGVAAAVTYLRQTVGTASEKLAITTDADHALRVNAQIGVPLAQANPPLEKSVEKDDQPAAPGTASADGEDKAWP